MAKRRKPAGFPGDLDPRLIAAATAAAASTGALAAGAVARESRRRQRRRGRYALEPDEPTAEGIVRVARAQLQKAIDRLADPEDPEAIHDARKALKRVRSLLRVSRPLLAKAAYRHENAALRDVGRALSDTRDSQALLESLDRLQQCRGADLPAAAAGQLRLGLSAPGGGTNGSGGEPHHDELREQLESVGARAGGWAKTTTGVSPLEGFTQNYRRGRRALAEAREDASVENLHELRKRTKDLWYGAQLLRRENPERMKALSHQAHAVSDLLGDHHDLALLRERAKALCGHAADAERGRLLATIDDELGSLEKRALRRARKLYRRPAGKFRRRLAG